MVQTYSNNKKIYSVDMMFAYLNIFKPKSQQVEVNKLLHVLEFKGWGDPQKNIFYSALDVINHPKKNKTYKRELERIEQANLQYPIILDNSGFVIDGVHRLSKAFF